LIRDDPVNCARYYRNIISYLQNLICHDEKYYRNIQNYLFVTEFQNKESEHDHGLRWINDTPIYGKNINTKIDFFFINTCHVIPQQLKMT